MKRFRCAVLSVVKHSYVPRGVASHPRFELAVVADDPDRPGWSHERNQRDSLAATRGGAPPRTVAPFADQDRMFEHLRDALTEEGYLFGEKGDSLMHALRQLIGRALPTPQEVKILHGLARQLLWTASQMKKNEDKPDAETHGM